jgi:hypothetical protein
MTKSVPQPNVPLAAVAGLLAWAIPGAGHVYLRRPVRGIILFVCIQALFWSGMAIGGVFTVDPIRQRWWFVCQMTAGASGVVGWYLQDQQRKQIVADINKELPEDSPWRPFPDRPPLDPENAGWWWTRYTHALADRDLALVTPAGGVARAYSGIAGLLNVLCIFDAIMLALIGKFGEAPREPARAERTPAEAPGGAGP